MSELALWWRWTKLFQRRFSISTILTIHLTWKIEKWKNSLNRFRTGVIMVKSLVLVLWPKMHCIQRNIFRKIFKLGCYDVMNHVHFSRIGRQGLYKQIRNSQSGNSIFRCYSWAANEWALDKQRGELMIDWVNLERNARLIESPEITEYTRLVLKT